MNEVSFNNLEEAVLCFYQSNNPLQAEAQKWLTELQNSPQIWKVIWEDLLPSKRTELQFYGATILHSKLLKDWCDVPANEYEPLKQKLLESVIHFKDGPKLVLNRLCITLAVYVIRSAPFWPQAVGELISLFQSAVGNVSPGTLAYLLLEILIVIPEEYQTILLSKNERILVRSSLENDSVSVISLLEAAFADSNLDLRLQVVKCAKSWLEFGLPPENCDTLFSHLIDTVLITYKNPDLSQCSINAIEAISILCNHPNNDKLPKRVVEFFKKLIVLSEIFNSSHEVANNDIIPCLYTLFITLGDSHIRVIVEALLVEEKRDVFLKLMYIILQASNAPGYYPKDEVYSVQTLNFWYSLQDEVLSDKFKHTAAANIVKPFYKKLVTIFMHKSMWPLDINQWNNEDKNTFRCYRQDIADTYMYCHTILSHELLDMIYQLLQVSISDPDVAGKWREIESYLFAFYAIAENAMCSEHPRILNCILLLQNLPLSNMNVHVSQTTMELLGSYAEWFSTNPQFLEPVLSLIFTGAENPQLAAPATLALKDITKECKTAITPYAEQIARKTADILLRKHLKASEEMRLIFSLGKVVSLLPLETIYVYLNAIVSPYVEKLQSILANPPEDRKKTLPEITDCIGVFTQLFLGLEAKPAVGRLLENVLPILKEVISKYKEYKVVSSVCIAIKCAVSNLSDVTDDCSYLPMIVEIILTTYPNNPHDCILDLAKQLLVLFGNSTNCNMVMSSLLKKLCITTLVLFENTTPENVSEHTSLFEHFYSFCANVLKKNSKLLLHTDGINWVSLFRYAGFALCAQEATTVKAASLFLSNVITISREQEALVMIVQDNGFELVYHIIIAIGKVSPRNCLDHIADVLLALSKKYCDWLSRWLNEILAQEDFPSPKATRGAKERFATSVLKEKANKRRLQDTTREFSFLCRGLLNKDYIEESSSSIL
ncbi:importin-13 isoform X2 [Planococcus citri]|uniref:importin-13 isoform X2 n=1 Tax=Planococcus citri TaxID=170843 RepID=UPI0031F78FD7